MSGSREAGPDGGDPMDLYHVFQSSYNKITKSEFIRETGYQNNNGESIYQLDSRFFPFDTSTGGPGGGPAAAKIEKQEPGDMRQWSSFGDPVTGLASSANHISSPGVLPSLSGYPPDQSMYYQDSDWGYSSTYPSSSFIPSHYPPSSYSSHHSPTSSSYPQPRHGQHSASVPGPHTQNIDEAINILRSHVDFPQVN